MIVIWCITTRKVVGTTKIFLKLFRPVMCCRRDNVIPARKPAGVFIYFRAEMHRRLWEEVNNLRRALVWQGKFITLRNQKKIVIYMGLWLEFPFFLFLLSNSNHSIWNWKWFSNFLNQFFLWMYTGSFNTYLALIMRYN